MADNAISSPAPGWRDRLGGAMVRITVVGLVLFDFWLVADQGIVAEDSPHDAEHFVRKAASGCWFGDESYTRYALFKEPTYSLFVAACYRLGLPLRLGHEALYLAAAGLLAWALVYRQSRPLVGLLVFAAVAFHPFHFYILQRALHDAVYPSLLMLAAGALLLQFKRRGEPGRWRRWLGTGLALGLLWNTRQEAPLVLVLLLPFLAAAAAAEWRRRPTRRAAAGAWAAEWGPPLAVVAAFTLTLMGANYLRWGVFAVSDLGAPNFTAAYRALLGVRSDHPIPYVPVTREMRERAYAASPSLRELAPSLEGQLLAFWEGGSSWSQDVPPQEYSGGAFAVALRDAAAEAGHYRSAAETEAYYGRVAGELRAAAAEGRLPTRWLPPGLPWSVNPDIDTYLPRLVPSWRSLWYCCWSFPLDPAPLPDVEGTPPEVRALFDRVACRRAIIPAGPGARTQLREWISTGYVHSLELVLAAGCLVAALVVCVRRTGPGWGMYLLPAAALGGYGLARLAVFSVFDASMFPCTDMRYLFPAIVALTVTGVWLLAEGLRLLGGALARRAPAAAAPPEGPPPAGRGRTVAASLLLVASLLLFAQWGYGKVWPPDFLPELGALEGVDGEHITGHARLKEQPDTPVWVEIYDGDNPRPLATVLADEFRQNCSESHMGNGRKGFSCDIPPRLRDWRPHTIRAKIKGTNIELWGSPKTVTLPGSPAPNGDGPVGGFLEVADGERIAGWAWDRTQPDAPIDVDIYEGDGALTLLATVPASELRQDLLDAKVGNGRHGFSFPVPPPLKDGKPHTIRVVTSRDKVELGMSPKVITPGGP
jgi:hypothetical protein